MIPNDDAQKLFVAGLPDSVTEEVLRDLFAGSGVQALDVSLPRDRMSGRPRGFAFVRLSSPEDVDRALQQLDGQLVGDSSISVRRFKAEPPTRGERPAGGPGGAPGGGGRGPMADTSDRTLYVGNLPYDVTQEEVETVLRERGADTIVRVHLPLDPDGRRRGFGFVTLGSAEAARTAVDQLQGAVVRGRTLTVNAALPKPAGGAARPDRAYNSPTSGGPPQTASSGPPANRFGPPAKPGGKTDFSKRKKSEGDGGGRGVREKRGGEASWQNNDDD